MLRGNFPARIDEKGRLKIPTSFRVLIEEHWGTELFVTSLKGDHVRIYPLPVWVALENKLSRVPTSHPARMKFVDRINFFGQPAELDKQGRVLIHPRLRDTASMTGEVDVFGQFNYLDVWNHERFMAKLAEEPFTDDDARALADFGI